MKTLKTCAFAAFALSIYSVSAFSVMLNGEYSIAANVTDNGSNSYTFDYYVTNVNQNVIGGLQPVGLDGLSVLIPNNAIISSIANPSNYTNIWPGPPSMWVSFIQTVNNQTSIEWRGLEWNSVYPSGETAHFAFTADNVDSGIVDAGVLTFWNANPVGPPAVLESNNAYYTWYSTQFIGPVAIPAPPLPEPSTFLLMGAALAGLGFMKRRIKTLNL